MIRHKSKLWKKAIFISIMAIFLVWTLLPIFIIVTNSFKMPLDISRNPPVFIFTPTLRHYMEALDVGNFGRYFINSVIISVSTTLISVICGSMAAYGLLIMKSKIGQTLSNFLLIGRMVPAITILIPFFSILFAMGLHMSHVGPIMAHSSVNLPFVTWLILGFMKGTPQEVLESSAIDGATRMQTFRVILIPMLTPAIASAFILSMQFSWNELLFSLQLTTMNFYTLPVGIARFVGALTVNWGRSSAAATITMVPIILVGFLMQKHLVSGLTAGAVKS